MGAHQLKYTVPKQPRYLYTLDITRNATHFQTRGHWMSPSPGNVPGGVEHDDDNLFQTAPNWQTSLFEFNDRIVKGMLLVRAYAIVLANGLKVQLALVGMGMCQMLYLGVLLTTFKYAKYRCLDIRVCLLPVLSLFLSLSLPQPYFTDGNITVLSDSIGRG